MAGTTSFLLTMVLRPYNTTTMTREIKDLQKLIEERAISKLTDDLVKLSEVINSQPLLQHNGSSYPPNVYLQTGSTSRANYEEIRVDRLFCINPHSYLHQSNGYMGQLYRHWLPVYIERESSEFLKKIDNLEQEVNHLLDNQPPQQC